MIPADILQRGVVDLKSAPCYRNVAVLGIGYLDLCIVVVPSNQNQLNVEVKKPDKSNKKVERMNKY